MQAPRKLIRARLDRCLAVAIRHGRHSASGTGACIRSLWPGAERVSLPDRCLGCALAPARLRRYGRLPIPAYRRSAHQAAVHLGSTPSASAVRHCLRQHLHVYLLEWMPASRETASNGLDQYTDAISRCVAQITGETPGAKTFLIGHSLGGTLAAIFGALAPEKLSGLALLSAPLCFQPGTSQFRDALTSLVPPDLSETDPLPGSLLSHMSALASPNTFVWSRLTDAFLSMTDHNALDIHARVERWALDEVPLPGKLVHQIIEWLYRENRLCRATLKVGETRLDPFRLSIPMLAIVNTVDEVAPLASVKPLADAMPVANVRIIEFPGEMGVCFQHLAILIGRRAHAQVWPEIISWLNSGAANLVSEPALVAHPPIRGC